MLIYKFSMLYASKIALDRKFTFLEHLACCYSILRAWTVMLVKLIPYMIIITDYSNSNNLLFFCHCW